MHTLKRACRQKHTQGFLDNGAGAPCVILGAGLNWEKGGKEGWNEVRGKGWEGTVRGKRSE